MKTLSALLSEYFRFSLAKHMIITRSPLAHQPWRRRHGCRRGYYEKFGGFLIAAAIDRYVYITLHETFVLGFDCKVFRA